MPVPVIIVCLFICCVVFSDTPIKGSVIQTDRLTSENRGERKKAYKKLKRERDALISTIIPLIKEKGADPRERAKAYGSTLDICIKLAGEYRMIEACEFLAKIIEYAPMSKDDLPFDLKYPAVNALIKIGKPSVAAVLKEISVSSDKQRTTLYCRVIIGVEGKEIAKRVLDKAIINETDKNRKENLKSALKHFE